MKTYVWQRSIASWMFFPALYLVLTSTANLLWLIPAFILYLTIALTVTIGYHRLFTHNAFECSRFWHWFFGFVGCISLNAAPVHWSSVHINHHRYTDTVDDPYDANWRHFFRFGERQNVKATKNELRMIRDKMHVFFLNYSFLLSMVYGSLMLAIDFNAFLYLYMFPVTLYLITSGLHTIFAHEGLKTDDTRISTARNLWLLEFLIPMGGEWIHKEHHDKPKLSDWHTKPHYFDLGAIVINVIKRHDKSTA